MKKLKKYLVIAFVNLFATSAHSEDSNFKWIEEIYMKKVQYSKSEHLLITGQLENPEKSSYDLDPIFEYKIICSDHYSIGNYSEKIDFKYRDFEISLSQNSDFRLDGHTTDSDLIKKIINSPYINIYEKFGNKVGELNFENLREFLKKHEKQISECKKNREQEKISYENTQSQKYEAEAVKDSQFTIFVTLAIALGAFILYIIAVEALKRLKNAKAKTKDIGEGIINKISDIKNKKFEREMERKIIETAIDEIVRQTVKRAMSEGVDPKDIILCPQCKGAGCTACSQKGWIK